MEFRFTDYLLAPVGIWRARKWMREAPFIAKDEFKQRLLEQLRNLCRHARAHVPFYREWFRHNQFCPDQMDSFDYWKRLPVLSKEIVRENLEALTADNAKRVGAVWCHTSGSTGTAMRFLLDRSVNAAAFALFWRAWEMAPGWFPGRRQANLSGYAKGAWCFQWKTNTLALSSFHLNLVQAKSFHQLLSTYQPRFLRGYPSALFLFGKLLQEQGLRLEFPVMFSGAETLLSFQRSFIESFFQTRLIDHYTHWERCASIRECLQGRLHAEDDFGYHEIVDEDGDEVPAGQMGRLVCTSLHNQAMPLLRYDTRDLATWSEEGDCPCGSQFRIAAQIYGRIEDVIVTPEARLVGRLDAAFKSSPNILLAQVEQDVVDSIRVNIVCGPDYDIETDEKPLLRGLRERLGSSIGISIARVSDLPRTPGGKLRLVVSRIPPEKKHGHH